MNDVVFVCRPKGGIVMSDQLMHLPELSTASVISQHKNSLLGLLSAVIFTLSTSLSAATFVVTNTTDNDGAVCTNQCSLRQAMNAANNSPDVKGPDKIVFAINPNDPSNDCRLVEDRHVCRIKIVGVSGYKNSNGEDVYGLPAIRNGGMYIDGSKPENRKDVVGYPGMTRPTIEITGEDANIPSTGLIINSKGSTIKGLVLHSFKGSPLNETGGECILISGFQLEPGNEKVFDASNNRIIANYLATDASGRAPQSTVNDGVLVLDGYKNTIGGDNIKDRNVILGASARPAVRIASFGPLANSFFSTDNVVQNNFIGHGVALENSSGNFDGIIVTSFDPDFGSPQNTLVKENRVGGVNRFAIASAGGSANTQVVGNTVSNNLLSANIAVRFTNTNGGLIMDNTIKDNTKGVLVFGTSNNISILKNSIYNNGNLGIDLNNDGVTLHDPMDVDVGPNNLQNFPVITQANSEKKVVKIKGQLSSEPLKKYRVEFFANKQADPSGYGEGECYLGGYYVNTNADGLSVQGRKNEFEVTLDPCQCNVKPGDYITSTATEMLPDGKKGYKPGSTSEFSAAAIVK